MRRHETADWVQREAHERLQPRITNPNWMILRARRKLFTTWVSRIEGTSLRVLDVGLNELEDLVLLGREFVFHDKRTVHYICSVCQVKKIETFFTRESRAKRSGSRPS